MNDDKCEYLKAQRKFRCPQTINEWEKIEPQFSFKIKTYIHATIHWYYIPVMIVKFFKALPNYNFKLLPRFKYSDGLYKIYSRNYV